MEENRDIYKGTYIHPDSDEIRSFALQIKKDTTTIREFFEKLFKWFDENIEYSRLNNPFTPLQRSDLDLLHMKSGTCGDYANLIVSILISLGIPAKYAYLKRDCYGDEQDHICAAAFIDDKWILIDATLPYRKWYGFDCPHQEYDLLEPLEFEKKMKVIEQKCISQAIGMGNLQYAGILYAPWIHDDIVLWNEDRYDCEVYKTIDDLFGLGGLYDGLFLEIYLRMKRIDDAADCLERYVNVLTGEKVMPKDYLFYPGLEVKKMEQSYPKEICKVLIKALEEDEQYQVLIQNPKCKKAIEKLKAIN